MNRRQFIKTAGMIAAGGVLSRFSVSAASGQSRENVLLIVVDDMAGWCGCMGGHPDARTPNIDRLAYRGLLFTNAHCASPICGPSRAAMLTGMRPETTNVYTNQGTYIDYVPKAVSFPRYFRENGYYVLGAGKINHSSGMVVKENWDEYGPGTGIVGTPFTDEELMCEGMDPTRVINRGRLKCKLPMNGGLSMIDRPNNRWDTFDWGPLDLEDKDFPDGRIAMWAAEQLGKKRNKPFLMCVGFYKPHQPFFLPRKYFEMFDPAKIHLPATIAGDLNDVPEPGKDLALIPWTSGTHKTVTKYNKWKEAVAAYLAAMAFADAQVGVVLDALDRSEYADNTWIIFLSDHGWTLGEKEHWGKHDPWSGSVKLPLIIVPPKRNTPSGFKPGRRCEVPVSLLDLYPSLLEMCSLPRRENLEGESLVPLLSNPERDWNKIVVSSVGRGSHSVFTKDWRYIHYFDGSEELYDLKADPKEWFNLANDNRYKKIKEKLKKAIPVDRRFKQFVRWGRWKYILLANDEILLFDIHGDMGISEHNNVADSKPDVVEYISNYLKKNKITDRYVNIPWTKKHGAKDS